MSCNFFVPDHYFDKKLLLERREKKLKQESYTIPLNVFWRPVELKDLQENYDFNFGDRKYF